MNDLIILQSITEQGTTGTVLIQKIAAACKKQNIPDIAKPTRYAALTRLEKENYIFKQQDITNLRRCIYTITEKGIDHRKWLRKRPNK
jgi:DNA-binding PadR family transcriptional regulator